MTPVVQSSPVESSDYRLPIERAIEQAPGHLKMIISHSAQASVPIKKEESNDDCFQYIKSELSYTVVATQHSKYILQENESLL